MKTPKAVALAYKQHEEVAPRVVASGRGELAERIIAKAKSYDIPLFQNEMLADSLLTLDMGETVPPMLYRAVADVFVWLLESERKAALSN